MRKPSPQPYKGRAASLASALGLLLLVGSTPARAQGDDASGPALDDKNPARVRLVAAVDVAPREDPFWVGAYFEMLPDWHIYWTFPGNTGQPTKVAFRTDERRGMVGAPGFPAPEGYDLDDLDSLSFGWTDELLVSAEAVVFDPEAEAFAFSAEISWLACKHLCIKGQAKPSLSIPVGAAAKPSAWAPRFEKALAQVPEPLDAERAWLDSLTYTDGRYEARYVVTGFRSIERFVPRWLTGGYCKVVDHGAEPMADGRHVVHVTLEGDTCLPGAGGVIIGSSAAASGDGPPAIHRLHAYGPPPPAAAAAAPPVPTTPSPAAGPLAPVAGGGQPFLLLLVFALLGGLLLNVMPCVIPVVVPKLLGVVRTAEKGSDPRAKRKLLLTSGVAYFAGVEATMLAMAIAVVALKLLGHEVGWGFQFQNPWFLTFMVALMVVLSLGMLHVFSLKSSQHQDQMSRLAKLFYKSPVLGSFLTGLLVTFLGTPCTAPMLGPALGYAFTASNVEIFLFLLMVGVGLALPFLLLGVWTGWTRILPRKVSERYDRAMRGLAFLLLATAVWLLTVIADGYSSAAAMNVVWFVTALGFATWLFGQATTSADPVGRRIAVAAPLLLIVVLFGGWILDFPTREEAQAASLRTGVIEWQPFSDARLAEVRAAGKTVFIDFTADWCMNCKANERLVIEKEPIRALLEELDAVPLKADHTRFNPEIHAWLKRFNRAGVPMYLVFPPCGGDEAAQLLPEVLTGDRLKSALRAAGASRDGCN